MARDGDGDGFVHDGTPRMRPVVPRAPWLANIDATWSDNEGKERAQAAFSALPDDAPVMVFHGTTKEHASSILRSRKVATVSRGDLPTHATDHMYIAPTKKDALNYGEYVIGFVIPKGSIMASPEDTQRGTRAPDVGRAFFNSFDGAIVGPGTPITARTVHRKIEKRRGRRFDIRPNPKSTPKEIAGSHGHRPHGPSILWPALYEHLRRKGMTKRKAAMISNGQWRKKRGLPPKSVPGTKGEVGINRVQSAVSHQLRKSEMKLYFFEGRNTGIAASSPEEARRKKKRGGDRIVAVRTPSASDRKAMRAGRWVRTRRDGKSPGQSAVGHGRGYGPPRVSKMMPAPSDVLIPSPMPVRAKKKTKKEKEKRLKMLLGEDVDAKITKAADGDGDGFVNDGKPNMRPVNPAEKLQLERAKRLANAKAATRRVKGKKKGRARRGGKGLRQARAGDVVGRTSIKGDREVDTAHRLGNLAKKTGPKKFRALSKQFDSDGWEKYGLGHLEMDDRIKFLEAIADKDMNVAGTRWRQAEINSTIRELGFRKSKVRRPTRVVGGDVDAGPRKGGGGISDPTASRAIRDIDKSGSKKSRATVGALLRSAKGWKEALHPRDAKGRFAEKGGGGSSPLDPSKRAALSRNLLRSAGVPDSRLPPPPKRSKLPPPPSRRRESNLPAPPGRPNVRRAKRPDAPDAPDTPRSKPLPPRKPFKRKKLLDPGAGKDTIQDRVQDVVDPGGAAKRDAQRARDKARDVRAAGVQGRRSKEHDDFEAFTKNAADLQDMPDDLDPFKAIKDGPIDGVQVVYDHSGEDSGGMNGVFIVEFKGKKHVIKDGASPHVGFDSDGNPVVDGFGQHAPWYEKMYSDIDRDFFGDDSLVGDIKVTGSVDAQRRAEAIAQDKNGFTREDRDSLGGNWTVVGEHAEDVLKRRGIDVDPDSTRDVGAIGTPGNAQRRHPKVANREVVVRTALMDYLTGNTDRHGGNYVYTDDKDGNTYLSPIDNSNIFRDGSHPTTAMLYFDSSDVKGRQRQDGLRHPVTRHVFPDIDKDDTDAVMESFLDQNLDEYVVRTGKFRAITGQLLERNYGNPGNNVELNEDIAKVMEQIEENFDNALDNLVEQLGDALDANDEERAGVLDYAIEMMTRRGEQLFALSPEEVVQAWGYQ